MTIGAILERKKQSLDALVSAVSGRSEEQLTWRPDPGGWSAAMILEHVTLVETSMIRILPVLIRKAGKASEAQRRNDEREAAIEAIVLKTNREKYMAMEKFVPTGTVPSSQSLSTLHQVQGTLFSLQPQLESVDCESVTMPHPDLGVLNLVQWTAFFGIHEDRHRIQLERVLVAEV